MVTFPNLVRQLLGVEAPARRPHELRQEFARDLAPFGRSAAAWTGNLGALYDELHAHLVGDALPIAIGRFSASTQPRVSDKAYRERRARYLGEAATRAALDLAGRLERVQSASLANRYFPELALAWRVAEQLGRRSQSAVDPGLAAFDCLAVDEAQDLTPIEAYVLVQLASARNRQHSSPASLLMAGDEAQTVRPTDFEWGWLSDLLHSQVATPSEYKLSANLRSPRRIAELVNRVWDLYSRIEKQERPSGTGYAEIDDDANDQILYCTAAPGEELDELLIALAAREGLALITLEDTVPAFVPEMARPAVLTVSEAKGLDFHSVCVIDAGRQVERVLREEERVRAGSDLDDLHKRLAIDQLRVALSRPAERLIWLDVSPSERIVRQSLAFLNGSFAGDISSSVPAAVFRTLEEDELEVEERIQRCQADARQYLEIKPDMAWSRAQQAITLLGRPGSPAAVTDEAARRAAHLTLSEICFVLGTRHAKLAPELGRPNLFMEAHRAASSAGRRGLAAMIQVVERIYHTSAGDHLQALAELAAELPRHKDELEPWFMLEIRAKSPQWIETLEGALVNGRNAAVLIRLLPPFYEALGIAEQIARIERLRQRAVQLLVRDKQFAPALEVLQALPHRQPKAEAVCHEGLGDFRRAAECYRAAGNLKEALTCYRAIPDFEAALSLVREIGDHPAGESLEWMAKLQALIAQRPEKFTKVVTTAEKKLLEELLERSLGVTRRKPAQSKTGKGVRPRRRLPTKTNPSARS